VPQGRFWHAENHQQAVPSWPSPKGYTTRLIETLLSCHQMVHGSAIRLLAKTLFCDAQQSVLCNARIHILQFPADLFSISIAAIANAETRRTPDKARNNTFYLISKIQFQCG